MKYGKQPPPKPAKDPDACARCGSNATLKLHPEDKANESESKAEAASTIDAFFQRHQERFKALVLTYPDGRAEALFEELREMFWSATPAGSDKWGAPDLQAAFERQYRIGR